MAEVTRIKPKQYIADVEKNDKVKELLCKPEERWVTVEVQLCPVLVCVDGFECGEVLAVERFHGCGHGKGGVLQMEQCAPVLLSEAKNQHVFTLPGRYRLVRTDCEHIDSDRMTIEVQDITFEWANLWARARCCA